MLRSLILSTLFLIISGCGGGDYEESEDSRKTIPSQPAPGERI